ncbi:cobalamin biosynthesis protein CobG [Sagittula sp. MA-2]|uniref:cobalamin biosynthesis protein CobG n=1 Tax=Sagittula sp. MA-2 TaxID=3048007 RepID=UPI0024C32DDE|nr:cobalamin biosynthesis protein CobG [Sagittula sp. MA-2]WHZ34177.1 cobalamin biosynthesis protein CobG [Sagittula sp. MA-2]
MTDGTDPQVRGWCPGALRPMASGDGLVVRVRPRFARLTAAQGQGLCTLVLRYGDGGLEMTNRANLQIYGVAAADHPALLDGLRALDLLDADETLEGRRNVLVAPDHAEGDLTHRLTAALYAALLDLPELPAKVGFAVDTGPAPVLTNDPADFRFEMSAQGPILRADGTDKGLPVTGEEAIPKLISLATLFATTRTPGQRRARAWTAAGGLPDAWQTTPPLSSPHPSSWRKYLGGPGAAPPAGRPGASRDDPEGYAAPFGRIEATDLAELLTRSGASAFTVTPWRLLLLHGGQRVDHPGFITDPDDPLLTVSACRGAPFCPQATVETRELARRLAPHVRDLHVSGCAKGCARATPASVTVTGRDGAYDLGQGCAGETPRLSGLTADALIQDLTRP